MAVRSDQILPILQRVVAQMRSQNGSTCANALKDILCQLDFPPCSTDYSMIIYNNITSACSSLATCQSNVTDILMPICQNYKKAHQVKICQKFSQGTLNSQFCGALPQSITFPNWSIGRMNVTTLIIASVNRLLFLTATPSCRNKWINMLCVSIPFCSSDGTKILTAVTKSYCEDAINW